MEKKTIIWGNVTLGKRRPVVCVPVMGGDCQTLCSQAAAAAKSGAEVIELRADSFSPMPTAEEALVMCRAVRQSAPGIPLIFTLRTARDGGMGLPEKRAYEQLLCAITATQKEGKLIDVIDCELSVGDEAFVRIAAACREAGVSVVGSYHDFGKTPECEEIVEKLLRMRELGADVCKIAVMPRSKRDVLTLMDAALCADERLDVPLIAIAMGEMGVLTRLCGEWMGSCLTFGAASQASAPGQIDAGALGRMLKDAHMVFGQSS